MIDFYYEIFITFTIESTFKTMYLNRTNEYDIEIFNLEVSLGAGTQAGNYKRDRLWVRFPERRNENIKYSFFEYLI